MNPFMRPCLFIVLGIFALATGSFISGQKGLAPEELQAACEQEIQKRYNNITANKNLINECQKLNIAVALTSENAKEAEKKFAEMKQDEISWNIFRMMVYGVGIILFISGLWLLRAEFLKNKSPLLKG